MNCRPACMVESGGRLSHIQLVRCKDVLSFHHHLSCQSTYPTFDVVYPCCHRTYTNRMEGTICQESLLPSHSSYKKPHITISNYCADKRSMPHINLRKQRVRHGVICRTVIRYARYSVCQARRCRFCRFRLCHNHLHFGL